MMKLANNDILFHRGSLLDAEGMIFDSYSLEQDAEIRGNYYAMSREIGVANASQWPFSVDYASQHRLHIINGMGVSLGDSIIGLTAIRALRYLNPQLATTLYRPAKAPDYVEQLYRLADSIVTQCRPLPFSLQAIDARDVRIDIGNHVFWPDFSTLPMIDFFLTALGVDPKEIPDEWKRNTWLQELALPCLPSPWNNRDYVLFCPQASTPIRTIPAEVHAHVIEKLWQQYALPVLGFGDVNHAQYIDIRNLSPDTGHFLAWIKHASAMLTCDSAAVHAAAGFDIPTQAYFTSIEPELRVRDYPRCQPVFVAVPELAHLHSSAQASHIELVKLAYQRVINGNLTP